VGKTHASEARRAYKTVSGPNEGKKSPHQERKARLRGCVRLRRAGRHRRRDENRKSLEPPKEHPENSLNNRTVSWSRSAKKNQAACSEEGRGAPRRLAETLRSGLPVLKKRRTHRKSFRAYANAMLARRSLAGKVELADREGREIRRPRGGARGGGAQKPGAASEGSSWRRSRIEGGLRPSPRPPKRPYPKECVRKDFLRR